jgi:hypothetical protein
MVKGSSEPLGAEQGVDEIGEKAEGDEHGQAVIEDHGVLLEPVAGDGVKNGDGKETDTKGEHDDVEHERSPLRASGSVWIEWVSACQGKPAHCLAAGLVACVAAELAAPFFWFRG